MDKERDFGVSYQIVENVLREHLAEPLVLDLLKEILSKDIKATAHDLGLEEEAAE